MSRTKNVSRNVFFGEIAKLYNLIIPFIIRTVLIYTLGMEYVGLSGLFSSILSVLNLAELGVGSAMVFSMYKPIATGDKNKVCALVRLYKIYYRIIGLVILILGLLLLPFLSNLVTGDLPDGINMYVLYLMNLLSTVFSYWLFAYKSCLLTAHQRTDISHKITLFLNTIQYFLQIIVLIIFKDYYIYMTLIMIFGLVGNIVRAFIVDKLYPQYKPKGHLQKHEIKTINERVRDLFTSKIGMVIYNSVDTLVISSFLGLTSLAIFQNYFYIVSSVSSFIAIFFSSSMASIGNSIALESAEKNFRDLNVFLFIISWISGFCVCCFACLYQPFMKIWVGTENMLNFIFVICLCIYFFLNQISSLLNLYKDAAGIWHEDRFRPLITALVNLLLNIIMVQYIGLYGILLSTVISTLFIGIPWLLHNIFHILFHQHFKQFVKKIIYYVLITMFVTLCCVIICSFINCGLYFTFILRLIFCMIFPNLFYYVFYRNMKEWTIFKNIISTVFPIKIIKRINDFI